MAKTKPKRAEWLATYGTQLAGQAELDGVDVIARELELKWGVDRLRLLVSAELREKFDRQRYLLAQAIHGGSLEDVRTHARRQINAWRALDRAATDSGVLPLSPAVWEVALESGEVAAICRTNDDARALAKDGRARHVWTLDEIGRVLSAYPEVFKAKQIFPGAEVVAVRRHISDPLDAIPSPDCALDDPLPDFMLEPL